jgi:UDP-N-acetylmuramoyl-L-alanyl-D-glutamate--2,6-diaminopimelate ligase
MVTSDNPRTEDPNAIIQDIVHGQDLRGPQSRLRIEADRRKAIDSVIRMAKPHDVILIAGKGHEDYQIVGQERLPFSDFDTAKELLQ